MIPTSTFTPREIAPARGCEIVAVQRTEGLDGIFLRTARHHMGAVSDKLHGGPVREACKDHAGMASAIEEFRSALYPVLGI